MTIQDATSDDLKLSISQSCLALEVSRSGYYNWRKQPVMDHFLQEQMKDRIDAENSSEDLRLVATTVMEICRILSRMEKIQ